MPFEKLGEAFEFTQPVTLYFARGLFVPTAMAGVANAEEKYNAWFIMDRDHPDLKHIVALIKKVATFKNLQGSPARMPLLKEEDRNPQLRYTQNPGYNHSLYVADRYLQNQQSAGKSVEALDHLKGKLILTGRSGKDYPPRLGGMLNGAPRDFDGALREAQRAQFYNGVRVYPKVYFRVYEAFGGGVSTRISSVFSMGLGERIAGGEGGTTVPSSFPIGGVDTAVDPHDDFVANDEIPY